MYYHYLLPTIILLGWFSILEIEPRHCRCRPWEPCWPTEEQWATLNASIDNNLVRLKPVGYVCHEPTFDHTACNDLLHLTRDSGWRASQPGNSLIIY